MAASEAHLCRRLSRYLQRAQPELAYQLRDRKLGHLAQAKSDVIRQYRLHYTHSESEHARAALGGGATLALTAA